MITRDFRRVVNLALGGYTNFTPSLFQGSAISTTVTIARYQILGRTAFVQMQLVAGGAGTANQRLKISSIPDVIQPRVVPGNPILASGVGHYQVTGAAAYYQFSAMFESLSVVMFIVDGAGIFGASPAVTAQSGDTLSCQLAYEVN